MHFTGNQTVQGHTFSTNYYYYRLYDRSFLKENNKLKLYFLLKMSNHIIT